MRKFKLGSVTEIILDLIEITVIGTTIFILIYLFVGQLLEVTGDSMLPNLYDSEQIIAEKISVKFKPLQRGEIVIFRHPDENDRLLIKRLIGRPGEIIKVENGLVYIDGEVIEEPYLLKPGVTFGNKNIIEGVEYAIPSNSYIFMGDNRKESSDSRSFGTVREELVVGRALLVYFPLKNARLIQH